jgi:hypothetical protein
VFKANEAAFANERPNVSVQNEPKLKPESIAVDESKDSKPAEKASQQAQDMVKLWKEKNLKEGWLHIEYRISSDVASGVILPNGNPMPLTYLEDGWYYLDKKGMVMKSVVTLKDESETILQQSVFNGNTESNLTFGIKEEGVKPYELKLDRGFNQYLIDADALKVPINYKDVKYKDKSGKEKSGKEFSYREVYDKPVELSNSQEPVVSTSVLGTFDLDTNDLVLIRTIWKYSSGKEVLFEGCDLVVIEFQTNAPSDITAILENAK